MERLAKAHGWTIVGKGWREAVRKCECCNIAKIHRLEHSSENRHDRDWAPGQCLVMDTQFYVVKSHDGKKYKFTVKCVACSYTRDFYLRKKSDFFPHFLEAVAFFERQTGNKVKMVKSDQEYRGYGVFDDWVRRTGVDYYPSPKGHSQSNAVIERSHQTMEGPATAARLDAGLPASFWTDMERTSTDIYNRIPHMQVTHVTLWGGGLALYGTQPCQQSRPIYFYER